MDKNNSKKNIIERNKLFVIAQALLAGILCFICVYNGLFSAIDSLYKDKLYQIPRAMNNNIKIIAIDEASLEEYGPINKWDRSIYNELIDKIGDHASVVAFDVMFVGEMDKETDEEFKKNIESRDNVILANHFNLSACMVSFFTFITL